MSSPIEYVFQSPRVLVSDQETFTCSTTTTTTTTIAPVSHNSEIFQKYARNIKSSDQHATPPPRAHTYRKVSHGSSEQTIGSSSAPNSCREAKSTLHVKRVSSTHAEPRNPQTATTAPPTPRRAQTTPTLSKTSPDGSQETPAKKKSPHRTQILQPPAPESDHSSQSPEISPRTPEISPRTHSRNPSSSTTPDSPRSGHRTRSKSGSASPSPSFYITQSPNSPVAIYRSLPLDKPTNTPKSYKDASRPRSQSTSACLSSITSKSPISSLDSSPHSPTTQTTSLVAANTMYALRIDAQPHKTALEALLGINLHLHIKGREYHPHRSHHTKPAEEINEDYTSIFIHSMAQKWLKQNLPPVNREHIIHTIYHICQRHIFSLKHKKRISSYVHLYRKSTECAPELLQSIQKCEKLIDTIRGRLNIFLSLIKQLPYKDATWTRNLHDFVSLLSATQTLENGIFWKRIENYMSNASDSTLDLFSWNFGDDVQEIYGVLKALKVWSITPSNSEAAPEDMQIQRNALNNHIQKACAQAVTVDEFVFTKHSIEFDDHDLKILKEIPLDHIERSLSPSGHAVLFDEILVNSVSVDISVDSESSSDEEAISELNTTTKIAPEFKVNQFWLNLFTAIYNQFSPKVTKELIEEHAFIFQFHADSHNARKFPKIEVLPPETLERTISCLPVLRLMTNSTWLRADKYFRLFFPAFTQHPYAIAYKQGCKCSIKIKNARNFKVTQYKTYKLCYKLDLHDPKSFAIDSEHPLAELPVTWTVYYKNGHSSGSMQIVNHDRFLSKALNFKEADFIFHTLANRTTMHLQLDAKAHSKTLT